MTIVGRIRGNGDNDNNDENGIDEDNGDGGHSDEDYYGYYLYEHVECVGTGDGYFPDLHHNQGFAFAASSVVIARSCSYDSSRAHLFAEPLSN